MEIQQTREILLVDDDFFEAVIVQRVLRELDFVGELVYVAGGDEALAHLQRRDGKLPCVILLDLNMPRMSGMEFLEIVRADSRLRNIPVIVVTTSGWEQDRSRSFELGAVGYIVKSSDYDEFRGSISSIRQYVAGAEQRVSAEIGGAHGPHWTCDEIRDDGL